MDEYKSVAASIDKDGKVSAWHMDTGFPLEQKAFDLKNKTVTAFAKTLDTGNVAFGFSDGTVRFGRIAFSNDVFPLDQAPEGLKKIDEFYETDGFCNLLPHCRQANAQNIFQLELDDEVLLSEAGSPITLLDYRLTQFGERPKRILVALDAQGAAVMSMTETKMNMFTRKAVSKTTKAALPPLPDGVAVTSVLATEMGDEVYFADKAGRIFRYNTRDFRSSVLAETMETLPKGVNLTVLGFLMGEASMVVGGSDGSLSIYFLLKRENAKSTDGATLVRTRNLSRTGPLLPV